jgi:integrase
MALTVKQVAKATEPGRRYGDGQGLYLQVTPTGSRSWILRYERNDTRPDRLGKRRERWLGLGPVNDFTLDEARERARAARQLLRDGIDPLEARRGERAKLTTEAALAAARDKTFEQCAQLYFDAHSPSWKNKKHIAQFRSTLSSYAYPKIGKLAVAEVNRDLVLACVQPIWNSKNATAVRVLRRIRWVLDFAKVQGWRTGENPAAWDGNLVHTLPKPGSIIEVKHHPALPFLQVHDFVTQLRAREGIPARAFEFLILSAARTSEVTGARWSEIDLAAKVWTIPAARMKTGKKTGKEHRVPLTDRALEILKGLQRESNFVFPGVRQGKGLSHDAMDKVLKRMGRDDITVHGFRSTFRDWAAETTTYPNHVVEMALAHAIGSAVEKAYRRGDLFQQREQLMTDWARYIKTKPADTADNVTSIHARAV